MQTEGIFLVGLVSPSQMEDRCQPVPISATKWLMLLGFVCFGVEVVCGNAKSFTEAGRLCGISCSSA